MTGSAEHDGVRYFIQIPLGVMAKLLGLSVDCVVYSHLVTCVAFTDRSCWASGVLPGGRIHFSLSLGRFLWSGAKFDVWRDVKSGSCLSLGKDSGSLSYGSHWACWLAVEDWRMGYSGVVTRIF